MARVQLPEASARGGFEEMYRGGGPPPWDIGRPQGAFVLLEEQGKVGARVLDVGCGTGENALHMAARGHEAWGVDGAPTAVRMARKKAKERKLDARFEEGSVLRLEELGATFDTVIDSGLFHTLSDEQRPMFAASVRSVLNKGGRYFMLCFSEHEPGDWGPRRVTQAEIRATFGSGWKVESIEAAVFEDTMSGSDGPRAWLAKLRRA
ncbi:MAG TPA: class I SAM-dependent methyltransferase [Candidatus Thermoplasmatota archaeon]